LEDLVEQKIICRVNEPTDWVSSIVLVKKSNNSLRICLDPTELNKCIRRPHFPLPTIDQVLTNLDGARVFSTLDAKHGFW